MSKFKNLAKLKIEEGKTASYEMPFSLDGKQPVILHCLPGSPHINKPLAAAALEQMKQELPSGLDPEVVARVNVGRNATLLAKYVVRDWTGVVGDDGAPVPCTPSEVEEFLLQLNESGPDVFLRFLGWVQQPSNWRIDVGAGTAPKG